MAPTECTICCTNSKFQVTCCFCQFTCCRKCTQKFILESVGNAFCMQCKHEWNREFIADNCTQKFLFGGIS